MPETPDPSSSLPDRVTDDDADTAPAPTVQCKIADAEAMIDEARAVIDPQDDGAQKTRAVEVLVQVERTLDDLKKRLPDDAAGAQPVALTAEEKEALEAGRPDRRARFLAWLDSIFE